MQQTLNSAAERKMEMQSYNDGACTKMHTKQSYKNKFFQIKYKCTLQLHTGLHYYS